MFVSDQGIVIAPPPSFYFAPVFMGESGSLAHPEGPNGKDCRPLNAAGRAENSQS